VQSVFLGSLGFGRIWLATGAALGLGRPAARVVLSAGCLPLSPVGWEDVSTGSVALG